MLKIIFLTLTLSSCIQSTQELTETHESSDDSSLINSLPRAKKVLIDQKSISHNFNRPLVIDISPIIKKYPTVTDLKISSGKGSGVFLSAKEAKENSFVMISPPGAERKIVVRVSYIINNQPFHSFEIIR
tara:strand:+ start:80 stop:469 length:390 start_codon:yes stop_codon:yes gene_type:complete